jgi:hypothetical protein
LFKKTASASSSSLLSTFAVNPAREYKSLPVVLARTNQSTKKRNNLLLVLGNSSNNRKMSTSAVNLKLVSAHDNIIKSSQDSRLYRGLLLDNGLKCLVISDSTTDRSAASLDVHAGYMLDPAQFPGLAHFLEHMLFMGSKKVTPQTYETRLYKKLEIQTK